MGFSIRELFTEKREGACVFEGASVVTILKQYEQVYLHLGNTLMQEKEQRNQEEASEDEVSDTDNQCTTKQLIKQGFYGFIRRVHSTQGGTKM